MLSERIQGTDYTCTKVSDTYISTVAITELWVCSEKKINLGHKIVCPWEKTSHKNLNKEKLLRGKDQYSHPRI